MAPSLCPHAFIATRSHGATIRPSHRHDPRTIQVRGKKTKTTVDLSDLPQGVLPRDPLPQDEAPSEPAYPTVVLQARRNIQKFDNCVLLTRVGGFYELYFEHAEEYGPLLNLKVASKKTSAGPVPMVRAAASPIDIPAKRHTCAHPLARPVSPSFNWTVFSRSWSKIWTATSPLLRSSQMMPPARSNPVV